MKKCRKAEKLLWPYSSQFLYIYIQATLEEIWKDRSKFHSLDIHSQFPLLPRIPATRNITNRAVGPKRVCWIVSQAPFFSAMLVLESVPQSTPNHIIQLVQFTSTPEQLDCEWVSRRSCVSIRSFKKCKTVPLAPQKNRKANLKESHGMVLEQSKFQVNWLSLALFLTST